MACKQLKFTGRSVVLEYHIACGDEFPTELDWKRIGSMRAKEFSVEWDTVDGTDADSLGSLRENLASFQNMTISGDGTVKASGAGAADLIALTKHVIKPDATVGEPVAWFRMTFPDITIVAYMMVSSMSRSSPYDDVVTYSFEATATASDFGLIIEDTPDPDAADVTSVTVTPDTMALTVGQTQQAAVVVAPVGSPQGVVWSTSDPDIATVNQNGVITAVGEGVADITVTSTYTSAMADIVEVTVT